MKRCMRWVLFILLAGMAICWMLATPTTPSRLVYAQPNDATLFTIHQDIAGRYASLIHNPLAESLITSAGLDPSDVASWLNVEGHRLVKWLFSGECTLAYLPADISGAPDVWSFTDWLGWKTTPTRLFMQIRHSKNIERWGTYKTYHVYRLSLPNWSMNGYFTFAIVDEGIIGCISANPRAIQPLINSYIAKQSRQILNYHQLNADSEMIQAADKGWAMTASQSCCFAFTTISANAIHGECKLPAPTEFTAPPAPPLAMPSAAIRLLGDIPLGVLSATPDYAEQLFTPLFPRDARPFVRRFLELFTPTQIFAALLSNDYCGRFMRMKLPALIIGLEIKAPTNIDSMLNLFIDELNAKHQLGLILKKTSIPDSRTVYILEGTSNNAYSQLPDEERIACAVVDHLLLISNSPDALMKLIALSDLSSENETTDVIWTFPDTLPEATGLLWFNLDGGGKVLRLGLTAYGFKRLSELPANDSRDIWQGINEAKAWIDALGAMGTLRIIRLCDAGGVSYRFLLGP